MPKPKQFESTNSRPSLDGVLKEKYNFRSNYSPTTNWEQEHAQTNVEGAVEEPEI